ncbi:hypothetical protein JDW21_18735 [Bacillus subtilis]|uniref:hypothetical protein n=1 Tax=Bacillus subtilis TaxID=1423 RepID=UPI002ED3E2DB
MWDKLLTLNALTYMKKVSEGTEDDTTILPFFEYLQENVNYKVIVVLATRWHVYDVVGQTGISINYVTEKHASRFIMLMDYLSKRFLKGELK